MTMEINHGCVVDDAGKYVTFVLVVDGKIKNYSLSANESLISVPPPTIKQYAGNAGFIVPKWDGEEWTEGATSQEISAWEAEHPAMPEPEPTEQEQLRADVDFLLAMGGIL